MNSVCGKEYLVSFHSNAKLNLESNIALFFFFFLVLEVIELMDYTAETA